MIVKVCGITRAEDAAAVARLGADFVGLIRAASARQVGLDCARQIAAELPGATKPVLLFRDAPFDEIIAAVEDTGVRYVQLHGAEPVSYVCDLLRRCPNLRLLRAWEVFDPSAATQLREYLETAAAAGVRFHAVILDAPKGGPHPGYECLGDVSRQCHDLAAGVWCAGGLTPENVSEAVRAGQYEGVDVARGVEHGPGVKDHAALERFIQTVRSPGK